jgi:hypothetical protein
MNQYKWKKGGLIYAPQGKHGFDVSHCHKPTPLLVDSNTLRIYFGTRDQHGRTRTTFIDVSLNDPRRILYVHDRPVLDLGPLGAFDDSGANVCSIVRYGGDVFMYFIGWNPSTTVHTRNAIGVAISRDNGLSFSRPFFGPVLDRDKSEPYYTGATDVIIDGKRWKAWYTSGSEWKVVDGKPEIFYHIKYAESDNGFDWRKMGVVCIPPIHEYEANARPSVRKLADGYQMWYSRRDIRQFRANASRGYRGGFAMSQDGVAWIRRDDLFGVDVSLAGWDSEAIAYPYVCDVDGSLMMLYNGNGFGRTGMGFALADS